MSTVATQFEAPASQVKDLRPPRQRIAEYIFLFLIAFSLLNVVSIVLRYFDVDELPINPVVVAVSALAILITNPPKPKYEKRYFVVAWIFFALYVLIGIAAIQKPRNVEFKAALQDAVKLPINFIVIPWLGMRLANPVFIRRCFQMCVVIIAAGGIFAAIQFVYPGPFDFMLSAEGRGAGFWVNPNLCGALCLFAFLISFIWPFQKSAWNVLARLSFLAGMLASSSRADLGAFVLALVVALIVRKDMKTAIWVAFSAALVFTLLSTVDVSAVLAKIVPEGHRAASFARLANGEVTGVVEEDIRWQVWQYAGRVAMDNFAVGCGLTCMDHVAPFSTRGLGPHNFYLYILGTSGIVTLLAFLFYGACLFLWALQVKEMVPRAMSVAYVAGFAMMLMFDHAFPMIQAMCPMFLFFAVLSAEKDVSLPAYL